MSLTGRLAVRSISLTHRIEQAERLGPAADRIAAWLHETALRLFSESPYAKEHTEASKRAQD
jgi:hypothetical protein